MLQKHYYLQRCGLGGYVLDISKYALSCKQRILYLCYANQMTHDHNTSNARAIIKHSLATLSHHSECNIYFYFILMKHHL